MATSLNVLSPASYFEVSQAPGPLMIIEDISYIDLTYLTAINGPISKR